jgi:hypothetical protein
VANLDQVPEAGVLVIIDYPKFGGGLGGYARQIAVCPFDWPYSVMIRQQDAHCRAALTRGILDDGMHAKSMQRVVLVPEVTVRREWRAD